jgi:MYXO-CTERM domain-containing protein
VLSSRVLGIAALGATFFSLGTAHAHFVLTSPPAAHEQNVLGDPQKAPPCGDDGTATATNVVTAFQGGETITVTIDETIYHPGHYRIALAINDPSELPEEPPVTPGNQACGTAPIMSPPVFPVLADGVFEHTEAFTEPQSIEITLPDDVSCTNCTLQIIQFMSEHGLNNPGGCYYHHCASISIEGGAADGTTTMPAEDSGSSEDGGTTTAETTTSADGTATNADNGQSATDEDSATGNTAPMTAGDTDTDTDTLGSDDDGDESGCSCSASASGRGSFTALVLLLGLVALRRR